MRLLGVDLGARRVGLALSDELGAYAHPLETLRGGDALVARVAEVARLRGVSGIVVGIPFRTGGERGPEAEAAEAFCDEIAALTGLDVFRVDERLTTAQAEKALIRQGWRRQARKASIDQVAACLILQTHLDRRRHRHPGSGEDFP